MKKTWKEMDWVTCEFCGGCPCMAFTSAEEGFVNEADAAKCPSCKATGTISCDGEGGADVHWNEDGREEVEAVDAFRIFSIAYRVSQKVDERNGRHVCQCTAEESWERLDSTHRIMWQEEAGSFIRHNAQP